VFVALHGAKKVPWDAMFLNIPVWALIINQFACGWTFYTLLTWLPGYLVDQLHFDLKNAGFVAVLPYLASFMISNSAGPTADYLRQHYFSTTTVRKIFQITCCLGSGTFLVLCGFTDSVPLAVAFMTLSVGLSGFSAAGYMVNHIDIFPEYAGVLFGIANVAGTVPGVISPTLTGWILGANPGIEEWRIVFFLAFGIFVAAAIIWGLFASGEKQPTSRKRS